jgi:hypothetical protein
MAADQKSTWSDFFMMIPPAKKILTQIARVNPKIATRLTPVGPSNPAPLQSSLHCKPAISPCNTLKMK